MEASLFAETIDLIPAPLLLINRDGTVRTANRSAASALETDPGRLHGTPVVSWCPGDHGDRLERAISDAWDTAPTEIAPDPLFIDSRRAGTGTLVLASVDRGSAMLLMRRGPATDEIRPLTGPEHQDPVTGLLNRHTLPIVVERELMRAARSGSPPVAMLFVMLRDFKQINQMHGHQVGDLLLENSGIRIRETVRKSDFVFRWEGTNMVVLLPELATRLDGLLVAEKIHSAVTVPYRFRGLDLAPGCHVGIALFPDDATSADDLFNRANSAVIEAERRDEPYRYYDQETHQRASDRLTLKTGLQRAFERDELELYYQPIVTAEGRIAGAEALMRWNHPTRGVLGPADFIELAEDSRLIAPIDKLAMYSACRQLVAMADRPEFFVSMNVSAINLSDATLPTVVAQALKSAGVTDPSRLKLELTESRTAENRPQFLTVMNEIQSMGVEIWIDDFGTGQSSLSYLKHLPVSTVKIDKDFVAELAADSDDVEYLRGIVSTVRSRNKRIVVEGISTADQLSLVGELPVDYLQGYHFARPMPVSELQALLERTDTLPEYPVRSGTTRTVPDPG